MVVAFGVVVVVVVVPPDDEVVAVGSVVDEVGDDIDVDVDASAGSVATAAWAGVRWATATAMPTAATVAVTPMAAVTRRMRTSAASRDREAS
ncbi:MAG: hypothetical protein ABSF84_07870 [Acidimicrobiales bacterium]